MRDSVVMTLAGEVTGAANRYELAERRYLGAVQAKAPTAELVLAALEVASAAQAWNRACYAHYFELRAGTDDATPERDADNQAEISEAISELWRDIAAAHAGRWEPPPSPR
jgi:hypothetical protein